MRIRLTIIDDHPLIVQGLQTLLSSPQIEVISTFNTGEKLLLGLQKEVPDVLLLDFQLPGIGGAALVAKIRENYPDVRILILTGEGNAIHAHALLQQGCMGFLLKSTTQKNILVEAIQRVYKGNIFLDALIKEELLDNIYKGQNGNVGLPVITKREHEVLMLIAAGLKSKEMADRLSVGIRTIDTHRQSLLQKLHVNNTAELIRVAMELKLIRL